MYQSLQHMKKLEDFVTQRAVANDPGSVLDAIDSFAQCEGGMMHLGAQKGEIFDWLVEKSQASTILELGTNFGYSAIRMARLCKNMEIDSVEIYKGNADIAQKIIDIAGLASQIHIHHMPADSFIKKQHQNHMPPYDLVFIDHFPENYAPDLQFIEKCNLLKKGGVVIADNVILFQTQLQPFLQHLRESTLYLSTLHALPSRADGLEYALYQGRDNGNLS